MEINKQDITRLTALGDSVFQKKLESALDAAGASDAVREKLTGNIPQIKKTLESLTQKDLEMLAQKLDEATINAVKDSLGQ